MPDPSVQPPEGLRQELISMVADRFAASSFHGPFVDIDATPVNVVDAVLAALFDACEVREEFGVEITLDDGTTDVSWLDRTREFAEGCVADHRRRGWLGSHVVRRCDLLIHPEPEIDI